MGSVRNASLETVRRYVENRAGAAHSFSKDALTVLKYPET